MKQATDKGLIRQAFLHRPFLQVLEILRRNTDIEPGVFFLSICRAASWYLRNSDLLTVALHSPRSTEARMSFSFWVNFTIFPEPHTKESFGLRNSLGDNMAKPVRP